MVTSHFGHRTPCYIKIKLKSLCEYIVRLSRNVLWLACCSAAVIYAGGPPTKFELRFHLFFSIYSSITIGMGVIYLVANRVNKQINKRVTKQA